MKLYAQITNDGTAMSETAVCVHHLMSHRNHLSVTRDSETGATLNNTDFVQCGDVDGGNDDIACNICGADRFAPDLIGKTVSRVVFWNESYGFSGDSELSEPTTTLHFTDGTVHTFVHPAQEA